MIERRKRCSKDGKTYQVYRVRWDDSSGRERSKTLPRGATRADAEVYEARVRLLKRTGELDALDAGRQLLADFAAEWWELYAGPNLARSTLQRYSEVWNTHVLPHLGHLTLRELNPELLTRFRLELERKGVGAPTIRKCLTMLQGMLERAVEWQRIGRNPVVAVQKPPFEREREVIVLAPESIERLRMNILSTDREGRGHRDATLVSVLAYAGLRPWSEAAALTWRDLHERTMQVWATKTRRSRRRARVVDLLGPLASDLAEWWLVQGRPRAETLIFGRWEGEAVRNWRRRIWHKALEDCELDTRMVPYDLRHSFASLLIHEGRDLAYIADQLGHSPQMTLSTYTHVMRELRGAERVPADEQVRHARVKTQKRRRTG